MRTWQTMAASRGSMLPLEIQAYERWKEREMRGEWNMWDGEPARAEMNDLVDRLMAATGLERGPATIRLGDLKGLARRHAYEEGSALGLNGTTAASIRNTTLPANGQSSSSTLANRNGNGANTGNAQRSRSRSR
ncbi:hypothetical protein GCM10009863_06590 [Streptomyces axinellae]|uniref:Uncharacterized protein n=1 Tax=Streptomyces axinellae TaxID=552788 RepID=A0ABP6C267_9ACTN